MPKQRETIFAERVDRDLKEAFGKDVHITNIQQRAKAGDPDRIICLRGNFIAIELKVKGGVLSEMQKVKLSRIANSGGRIFVATPETWNFVLYEIKAIYERELYKT